MPKILDFECKRKGKRMVQLHLILGQGLVYLLYALIFSEMVLIMTLLFDAPMTKTVIMELDSLKLNQGKGLLIVKIVTGTLFLVLIANFYSLLRITMKNRTNEGSGLNPTEEVLKSMNILQISLIGNFSFRILLGLLCGFCYCSFWGFTLFTSISFIVSILVLLIWNIQSNVISF